MYPLKKIFFLQCNCSFAAFLCLNHLLIVFFFLKKEIIRKSVMCAKLTDILEQTYSKSYHRFNWHFLITCSSKSAWKQIESWLSLPFKTTLCCVWLFKRYADYFSAWHYAAMFFINMFKHFFLSLSWWMWLFSLTKWVFLHLFIMFLMSAWVRGCIKLQFILQLFFSNCIRSASGRVSLHFLFFIRVTELRL